jgi:hypothetical protein
MIARRQCVLWLAHAIMAKSAPAAVARRVGRVSVTASSTHTTIGPNLKAGLIARSSAH